LITFRRKQEQAYIPVINQLKTLIEKDEVFTVPGIVLQELLTGLKEEFQFNRMYTLITGFTSAADIETGLSKRLTG